MLTTEVQWNASAIRFDASTMLPFGFAATTIQPAFSTSDFSSREETQEHFDNVSTSSAAVSGDSNIDIPVRGLNEPLFSIVHGVALGSLAATILVSTVLLTYLFTCGRRQKDCQQPKVPQKLRSTASVPSRDSDTAACSPRAEPIMNVNKNKAESPVDSDVHIGGKDKVPRMLSADTR
jgi:hypothetical protein